MNHRLPVLVIPGVVRIVGLGKIPVPMEEEEIAAVQAVVASGLLARPFPFLKIGQTVTIAEGPLRSVTGIITAIDGSDHLIVSISLLQRSLAVALPRHWIQPVRDAGDWACLRERVTYQPDPQSNSALR